MSAWRLVVYQVAFLAVFGLGALTALTVLGVVPVVAWSLVGIAVVAVASGLAAWWS